jgi:uncharacterized repeat protein (TIGR01451 family)
VVTNTGNVTLHNVTVIDPLPGLSTITCDDTTIPVGGFITCTATYAVTQADIDSGSVYNLATADSDESGPDDDDNTESLPQNPAIELIKTGALDDDGDGFAEAGEVINYTFTVTNTGNVTLYDVVITDTIGGVTISGGPTTLDVGEIDSTTFTGSYTLTQVDIDAGHFYNLAEACGTSNLDDEACDTDDHDEDLPQNPAIQVLKSGAWVDGDADGFADAGEVINYTFIVNNIGNVTLYNVTVTDPSVTVVGGPLASLAPAASDSTTFTGSYTITQTDIDAGHFYNLAEACGTSNLDDEACDTNDHDEDLPQNPALAVEKVFTSNDDEDSSNTVSLGDTLHYTITATNTGNVTLHNVVVSDSLTGDDTTCASVAPAGICILTVSYVVTQVDVDAGNIHNVGTADSDETPPTDEPEDVSVPQNPAIELIKTGVWVDGNGNGFADAGEVINYTFIVSNIGNVTLTSITLADTIGGVTVSGGPIASLAPGASDSTMFTGSYTLTQADVDAGHFYNKATACGDDPDADPAKVCDDDDETVTFPPRLIVKKIVINDNGGTRIATDFSFQVNGVSAISFIQDGSDPLKGKNTVTVTPGGYSVTEPAVSGYMTNYSSDCEGNIANGETKTCTITNDDISPTLTVVKVLLPSNDTGLFNLQIDGVTHAENVGDNGTSGAVDVNAGVVHTVGETAGTGTSLSDYVTTIGGDCATDGTVSLALAQNKTCTITNIRRGSIVIVKNALGGDGSFDFTSSTLGNFSLTTGGGTASTTFSGLDPANTYDVAETVPAGWELNSATCNSGETIDNIDLDPGETVTCTFENEKFGSVVIVKNTVGGDGTFDFTSSTLGNFSLATASNTASTTFSNLDVDLTYDVAETVPAGWDLTGTTCNSGETISSIDLDPGETVTCTFTNTKRGHIIVDKVTLPSGNTQSFAFTTTGTGYNAFNLMDASAPNDQTLVPGSYTVTETALAGWDLTGLTCTDPSGGTSTSMTNRKATISLAAGETVTCTFTNTKRGKITIIKDALPNDAQDFAFTSVSLGNFSLDDDSNATLTNTKTVTNLVPGAYSVTEGAVAGWDLTGLTCNDANGNTNLGTRTANIALDPGEEVTCTFTNTKRGTIIVEKQTNPNGAPGLFTFTGTAAGTIADNGTITVSNLVPGTYTSTESNPSTSLFALTSIVCSDGTSASPSTGNLTTRTATFRLDPGETVRCVFTNTKDFHAGTIGFWKNWRNHYTTAQFQLLINYLKTNNPRIYNKDLILNNSDDLTIAKHDAIMNVGNSTPREQMILAQFTALKFNLAITQLQGTSGLVQKNDNLCTAGTIDASGISGAATFFGTSTPTIGQVVNAVESKWTGNLTTNRNNWTWNLTTAQKSMLINVLSGINEGTLVMSSGCP